MTSFDEPLDSKDKPYVKALSLSVIQVYSTFDPLIKYRN